MTHNAEINVHSKAYIKDFDIQTLVGFIVN